MEGLSRIRSRKQLTGRPQFAVRKVCVHDIDSDICLLIFATYVNRHGSTNRRLDKVKLNLI